MTVFFRTALYALAFGIALIAPFQAPMAASSIAPIEETTAFSEPVTLSLVSETSSLKPGQPTWVALHLKIEDSWHAYWKNPGDAGMAPIVIWNLPEGFEAGPLVWPTPTRFTVGTNTGFGYENDLVFLAQITPPATFKGSSAEIGADVRWIVCNDSTCLPGDSQATATIEVKSDAPKADAAHASFFTNVRGKTPVRHTTLSVERHQGLLELCLKNLPVDTKAIVEADFISETPKAIKSVRPALVDNSTHGDKSCTLVLEENNPEAQLKGILVVHTKEATFSYEIDTPIASSGSGREIASLANRPAIDDALPQGESQAESKEPLLTKSHDSLEFKGGFLLALVFAYIGGMILNLMPCVLPVISLKVLGFVKMSGQSRGLIFKHGIAFSVGVLLSFWVLASVLLILQSYGRSVGWGFQLQEPIFVAILAALLFVFGLSLFGLFEVGASIMSAAGEMQYGTKNRNELFGSFLSGILATAIATPCTGPFLGSAVGFAVTLPAAKAMAVFTSLGIGMSFPYLLLAAFPALLKFMPKPGQWMITFKELMGFLMMASVIWLVWVFTAQTNSFSVILLLAAFFFMAIGCWIYGRWATPMKEKLTRTTATLATVAFFATGCYVIALSTSVWAQAMGGDTPKAATVQTVGEETDVWEEFSPERVAELRAKGIPVFIDFTAKWCLICQTNHIVLSSEDLVKKFNDKGVVKMKADWTKRDDIIAEELRKFGRNSVPLYVLYDSNSGSEPQILPQVLTPDVVDSALDSLKNVR